MISYETALKLKEAGFPNIVITSEQIYSFPNLEELIEACGDDWFFQLTYMASTKNWFAELKSTYQGKGSTPSEAVANLYLALNK